MNKNSLIGRFLILFGVATILSSLVDISIVILPPHLSSPEWTFSIVQQVAERSIIPIMGIISLIAGCFIEEKISKKGLLNLARVTALYSGLFGLMIVTLTILYALTINTVEVNFVKNIKNQADMGRKQLTEMYKMDPNKTPEKQKMVDKRFNEIDQKVKSEIENSKKGLLKKNIKTFVNLILFCLVYLFVAIVSFKHSTTELRKLKYKKA